MTKVQKKAAVLQAVNDKIAMLATMLTYAESPLTPLKGDEDYATLITLERWLNTFLKVNSIFLKMYTQPHTGVAYWENMKILGIPKDGLYSKSEQAKAMRNLLHRIHTKYNARPEVVGGSPKVTAKAGEEDTGGDNQET